VVSKMNDLKLKSDLSERIIRCAECPKYLIVQKKSYLRKKAKNEGWTRWQSDDVCGECMSRCVVCRRPLESDSDLPKRKHSCLEECVVFLCQELNHLRAEHDSLSIEVQDLDCEFRT